MVIFPLSEEEEEEAFRVLLTTFTVMALFSPSAMRSRVIRPPLLLRLLFSTLIIAVLPPAASRLMLPLLVVFRVELRTVMFPVPFRLMLPALMLAILLRSTS